MNWYYVDQGQQAGPVDDAQLDELRRSGKIQPDTLVWHEGMANWVAYQQAKSGSAPGATPAAPAAAATSTAETVEAVCAECGGIFAKEEIIRFGEAYVCRNCKPIFMQKLAEGARLNVGGMQYAGFWIRFAAKLLDGLILFVVLVIPVAVVIAVVVASSSGHSNFGVTPGERLWRASSSGGPEIIANLFGVVFQFALVGVQVIYSTIFNGKYGATPGKMICKLKVVDADGNPITYGRAFGRGCAEILSGLV